MISFGRGRLFLDHPETAESALLLSRAIAQIPLLRKSNSQDKSCHVISCLLTVQILCRLAILRNNSGS